jgi:hypothetical protein
MLLGMGPSPPRFTEVNLQHLCPYAVQRVATALRVVHTRAGRSELLAALVRSSAVSSSRICSTWDKTRDEMPTMNDRLSDREVVTTKRKMPVLQELGKTIGGPLLTVVDNEQTMPRPPNITTRRKVDVSIQQVCRRYIFLETEFASNNHTKNLHWRLFHLVAGSQRRVRSTLVLR